MTFIRTPLAFIGYGLAVYLFRPHGSSVGAAAGVIWATVTISVVNVISLTLLVWRFRAEHLSIRNVIGIRKGKILADLGYGLLWAVLLYGLLVAGIAFTLVSLRGTAGFAQFEEFLLGEDPDFSFTIPFGIAMVSATVFPILNPVVEELNYRGYCQPRLARAYGTSSLAIVVTAVGFGVQHMAFAMTVHSAIAFAVAFFLWGLGAGVIVHTQQRLLPIMVAHFVSNLSFGVAPLLFSLAQ